MRKSEGKMSLQQAATLTTGAESLHRNMATATADNEHKLVAEASGN
jgi:hypothetical protein